MTEATSSRSVRVRTYRQGIRDASRTYHLSAGADIRAALTRAALAAVPQTESWTLRAFTVERTAPGERITAVLDLLAHREMGGAGFAAALAATFDDVTAVLAIMARGDAACIERVRSALVGGVR